jgi:hypothetical protein
MLTCLPQQMAVNALQHQVQQQLLPLSPGFLLLMVLQQGFKQQDNGKKTR